MDGYTYVNRIANYIKLNYGERGVTIYTEINVGKTIIGKNRRIDILLINESSGFAYAVECKYQNVHGTVDEKIPYTLDDIASLPMKGCIAYAGEGFSQGVLHMLEAHPMAAFCLPTEALDRNSKTRELDHLLAIHFQWWDVITEKKVPL